MWIIDGLIAGLLAGIVMGIVSQVGYWLGAIRSHLIVVDGAFTLRTLKRDGSTAAKYLAGTLIHLGTSVVFGIVYAVIAQLAGFEPHWLTAVAVYVFVLWLAMLLTALPVAGQGLFGNKIRGSVWLEQFFLHVIFAISFWWVLGIV